MRKYMVGIGALGLITTAAIWHARDLAHRLDSVYESVARLEQTGQVTKREVQSLANESAATRIALSTQVRSPSEENSPAPAIVAAAPLEPAPEIPMQENSVAVDPTAPDVPVQRAMDNLHTSFDSQTIDRNWAVDAASSLREKARALLGENSEIQSLECRSTMCKMETIQSSLKQYQDFGLEFAKSRDFPQLFLTRTGETSDGRLIMTMYLAKEGTQLPYAAE